VAGALSVAAMVWVTAGLVRGLHQLELSVSAGQAISALAGAGLLYAVLTFVLATAWWWLLGLYDSRPRLLAAYAIWARTQIAKYLPGNILHYAGRHVLGYRSGLSHAGLVAAGVLETVSTALAALLVAVVTVAPETLDGAGLPRLVWWVPVVLGLIAFWPLADRILRRLPATRGSMERSPPPSFRRLLVLLVPALALHLVFFCGTGLLFFAVLRLGWPAEPVAAGRVVGLFALAWLAGTAMPGAPGGLGVREAIIVLLLGPSIGHANASAAALALRAVTLTGDLGSALAGWLLGDAHRYNAVGAPPDAQQCDRRIE
jgi:uncharacterized membrane protein YbhN (UPF0104 family)